MKFGRLISAVILVFAMSLPAQTAEPSLPALRERVMGYYSALKGHDFNKLWESYLDSSMQRDTPKKDFIQILEKSVGTSTVIIGEMKFDNIGTTGKGDSVKPLGKVVTTIAFELANKNRIIADHTTSWLYRGQKDQGTWYLVGDEMKEKETSKSSPSVELFPPK